MYDIMIKKPKETKLYEVNSVYLFSKFFIYLFIYLFI